MVAMASVSGTTSTSSNTRVMTTTARLRRPHKRACTRSINPHVATTTVVAQIAGPMKGRSSHSVAAMSRPRHSTASVVRVRSRATFFMSGPASKDQRLSL